MVSTRGRGLILQHGVDGPPAILGEWLGEREIEHDIHRTWCDPLPHRPGDYGWIATLGSEHTPGAPAAPPWVDAEIEFLSRGLELGIPVLGLCFGGQTLAVAAGGSVGALAAAADRLDGGRDRAIPLSSRPVPGSTTTTTCCARRPRPRSSPGRPPAQRRSFSAFRSGSSFTPSRPRRSRPSGRARTRKGWTQARDRPGRAWRPTARGRGWRRMNLFDAWWELARISPSAEWVHYPRPRYPG